jgi:hypothetical protein
MTKPVTGIASQGPSGMGNGHFYFAFYSWSAPRSLFPILAAPIHLAATPVVQIVRNGA